jgi:hypothetical protein
MLIQAQPHRTTAKSSTTAGSNRKFVSVMLYPKTRRDNSKSGTISDFLGFYNFLEQLAVCTVCSCEIYTTELDDQALTGLRSRWCE